MWSKLPEGTDYAAVLFVGGVGLCDTAMLRQVSSRFQLMAEDAARRHLQDENAEVRMEALKAAIRAGEHGKSSAVQRILERAYDQDASLRLLATSSLTYLLSEGDAEAPAAVAAGIWLLRDSDAAVRQTARAMLAAVAGKSDRAVVAALASVVTSEAEDALRQEAAEALGALSARGDAEALGAIRTCLGDASLAVRREAVAALGDVAEYHDSESAALLCDCCADPDPTLRCALAHASSIIAPWGDAAMVGALTSLLQDSHAEVRARAAGALGAVARPADAAATTALEACAGDADERVRGAVGRARAMLVPVPDAKTSEISFPGPSPIEGMKSKKAALLRVPAHDEVLSLSLTSRVSLLGQLPECFLALSTPAGGQEAHLWRHPRSHVALVAARSVSRMAHQHARRTLGEFLAASGPLHEGAVAAHLGRFGLAGLEDVAVAELPRSKKALLALAAAFWPEPPHVIVLDEPRAWGLDGEGLEAMARALRGFSGGVLLATEDQELADSIAGERWDMDGHGVLQRKDAAEPDVAI